MFGKKNSVSVTIDQFSSLVSSNVSLTGDMAFEEGLKISGAVTGNVYHKPGTHSLLALSTEGRIEGNVSSYDALIDGDAYGILLAEHQLTPTCLAGFLLLFEKGQVRLQPFDLGRQDGNAPQQLLLRRLGFPMLQPALLKCVQQ